MDTVAKIKNLSHTYGKTAALEGITLEIPSNCIVGFIGPDGMGKSTLLSIVAGVRKIQTGTVEVFGGDINDANYRSRIHPKIAYMPQGLGKNLYMSLSVYENIEFFARLFRQGRNERQGRIDALMKSLGLYEFKDRPAGKLSGGMKQKLGLCCALIHDPDLLILDEPTTGVDPLSRRQFWEIIDQIRTMQQGMSVLVATAYMQEAQKFDHIIAINNGKILANATPRELLKLTKADSIDSAYIALLPRVQRRNHADLTMMPNAANHTNGYVIEAENLTMKFGDFTAVDRVNFQIKQGEIFGFLGSNGCGKTTTMKMLTGLLAPSEGSVRVFGKSIKSDPLEMKKNVGYMTQSFSLYSELTVIQNLVLHAQLYHIDRDNIEARVEEMLTRFDLKKHENTLSEDLPLGIKQRLSLAAAVIHKPKMLILDEPTSGVDPVSRDNFWEFLIDLAHNDGVTIFISTHFMDEGERCSRISLMHQGKVLISDTPQNLIASKNKKNLEEAFVDYLYDAIGKDRDTNNKIILHKSSPKNANDFFSFMRFLGYVYRESLELIRDPIRLTFALVGTMILMLVMGYGINMDIEDLKFSVLDHDKTPQSRNYIQYIAGSKYFIEHEPLESQSQLDEKMKNGQISLAIEIPANFGRNVQKGQSVEVGVWIDGTVPFRAETIQGYVAGLHSSYIGQLYGQAQTIVDVQMRYRYNQDFKSIYAMVPAVIPMLLIFIPSILMALSVVREKELGSITNFYATPVTKLEFLLGKQLPYVVVSMIGFMGMVFLAVFVFGVPMKGSFIVLFAAALLYVVATTGMGLLISAFAKTQIAALGTAAIATLLPTINYSGLMEPVSSLEGVGFVVGNIFPATYFSIISRGIFSKDIAFFDLYVDFGALILSIFVITFLSVLALKKQES